MSLLSFALLLAAASSRLVLDDVIEVPRAEWRYVEREVDVRLRRTPELGT